ncbi:MAG TPA: ribose-5-phosphate isomerase RpiA [Blastocatellia bacterium]
MSNDKSSKDIEKANAARRAVEMVRDGQVVGLGTGSTAIMAINELGKRVAAGLKIRGVATSVATHRLAVQLGIPMIDLDAVGATDITIDGADQIDPAFDMIKGGGGALVREKLVAIRSMSEVIVIDSSKQVKHLGAPWSLPVEVLKFAWRHTASSLGALGSAPTLRKGPDGPFESDNGNYILDCEFGVIDEAPYLERTIKLIPGVVECGLFIRLAAVLVVGIADGAKVIQCVP